MRTLQLVGMSYLARTQVEVLLYSSQHTSVGGGSYHGMNLEGSVLCVSLQGTIKVSTSTRLAPAGVGVGSEKFELETKVNGLLVYELEGGRGKNIHE